MKICSSIEKEISVIESNFIHVKNEYLYYELNFSQHKGNEKVEIMKKTTLEELFKSFMKLVVANNESDNDTLYLNRLRLCARLIDVLDINQLIVKEKDSNFNN